MVVDASLQVLPTTTTATTTTTTTTVATTTSTQPLAIVTEGFKNCNDYAMLYRTFLCLSSSSKPRKNCVDGVAETMIAMHIHRDVLLGLACRRRRCRFCRWRLLLLQEATKLKCSQKQQLKLKSSSKAKLK